MANDRLFVVQYSEETKELILSDFDDVNYFESEILNCVNCSNNSLIKTKSLIVNDSLNQITKPYNYEFLNPFNVPVTSLHNGFIYNGLALKHADFCPIGFHFPSVVEFQSLIDMIGVGADYSSGHFKKIDFSRWTDPNYFDSLTDFFNLSFLPSGHRPNYYGQFTGYDFVSSNYLLGTNPQLFESFTLYKDSLVIYFDLLNDFNFGCSTRLIKDTNDGSSTYTDLDGNIYPLINVNGNLWLGENYKCTKLNNGVPISNITDNNDWINTSIPAYCIYNNDPNLL